jgi:hypothetical protein
LLRQGVCLTGGFHGRGRKDPAFAGSVSLDETRERDVAGHELARPCCFSLTGIDSVPLWKITALNEKEPRPWPGHTLSRVGLQFARRLR